MANLFISESTTKRIKFIGKYSSNGRIKKMTTIKQSMIRNVCNDENMAQNENEPTTKLLKTIRRGSECCKEKQHGRKNNVFMMFFASPNNSITTTSQIMGRKKTTKKNHFTFHHLHWHWHNSISGYHNDKNERPNNNASTMTITTILSKLAQFWE